MVPQPLPPPIRLTPTGVDRLAERIRALEVASQEQTSQLSIETSRITLLVREVAKLAQRLNWRTAVASAVGSATVHLLAKLVG